MENGPEFAKWWSKNVVEPKVQQQKLAESENKVNKFDVSVMNWMTGLINCIRNNSIMPVVYPESGNMFDLHEEVKHEKPEEHSDKPFTQALNLHGEFFHAEHENIRSLSKVVVTSKDVERIRKIICLQTLWLLLNDSQKKISVICSEVNKPYYEEFFSRQRKLYNNLNNVRFYTDLHSCAVNNTHTLKKDGEMWFFDSSINGSLSDIMGRVKDLNAFWIFTTQEDVLNQHRNDLESMNVKISKLDEKKHDHHELSNGISLKFPLRLQADLLVIGDMVEPDQMKSFYNYLEHGSNSNQSSQYHNNGNYQSHHYNQQQQKQKSIFSPKKFKTVKFIRGVSIDNLRNSLKMHDSVQAQVVLIHVSDEDLFKSRNSMPTSERNKELANLVKEYCPKSSIVMSSLAKRPSRNENNVRHDHHDHYDHHNNRAGNFSRREKLFTSFSLFA